MLDLWWVLISDRTFLGPVSSNEPLFRICQSKLNIHQSEWGWYSGPTVNEQAESYHQSAPSDLHFSPSPRVVA